MTVGPVATLIATACLEALKWLFWITAGLLAVMIVVQGLRGDAHARPLASAVLGLGFAAAGLACGWLAARLRRAPDA